MVWLPVCIGISEQFIVPPHSAAVVHGSHRVPGASNLVEHCPHGTGTYLVALTTWPLKIGGGAPGGGVPGLGGVVGTR